MPRFVGGGHISTHVHTHACSWAIAMHVGGYPVYGGGGHIHTHAFASFASFAAFAACCLDRFWGAHDRVEH